jgi:hypothetical protein
MDLRANGLWKILLCVLLKITLDLDKNLQEVTVIDLVKVKWKKEHANLMIFIVIELSSRQVFLNLDISAQ